MAEQPTHQQVMEAADAFWAEFAPETPLAFDQARAAAEAEGVRRMQTVVFSKLNRTPIPAAEKAATIQARFQQSRLELAEELLAYARSMFNEAYDAKELRSAKQIDPEIAEIWGGDMKKMVNQLVSHGVDEAGVAMMRGALLSVFNPTRNPDFDLPSMQLAKKAVAAFKKHVSLQAVLEKPRVAHLTREEQQIAAEKAYMGGIEAMAALLPPQFVKGMLDRQLELYANYEGHSVREPGKPAYHKELQGKLREEVKQGFNRDDFTG